MLNAKEFDVCNAYANVSLFEYPLTVLPIAVLIPASTQHVQLPRVSQSILAA